LVQLTNRYGPAGPPDRERDAAELKRARRSASRPVWRGVRPARLRAGGSRLRTQHDQRPDHGSGRQILDLFRSGAGPVLVLDDTDRWLTATWLPDSTATRDAFFTTIPRLLSEELDAAAVIAVHPTYLDDAAYRAARGFLSRTITVPPVPSAGAVAAILYRRIALAMDATGCRPSRSTRCSVTPPW